MGAYRIIVCDYAMRNYAKIASHRISHTFLNIQNYAKNDAKRCDDAKNYAMLCDGKLTFFSICFLIFSEFYPYKNYPFHNYSLKIFQKIMIQIFPGFYSLEFQMIWKIKSLHRQKDFNLSLQDFIFNTVMSQLIGQKVSHNFKKKSDKLVF